MSLEYGAHFAFLRIKNELTQSELAERIGVSIKTIQNWEYNICLPDVDRLIKLADLYTISMDELLMRGKVDRRDLFDENRYLYRETIKIPHWNETYADIFIDSGYEGLYEAWIYDNNYPKIMMYCEQTGTISFEEFRKKLLDGINDIVVNYREILDTMLPNDEGRKRIREHEIIEKIEIIADGTSKP